VEGVFKFVFCFKKMYNAEMEVLGKLLGSTARVKIMRLFLLNKATSFSFREIQKRSLVRGEILSRELRVLSSVDFIKKLSTGYRFNPNFCRNCLIYISL